ncbi:hypothetical protein ABE437_18825 [Isoptericola cucumis]|uniref:hypothetical protein n=1 Tax=Isoptericola cucumis TaxID=1776856 RepID=UPI00320B7367
MPPIDVNLHTGSTIDWSTWVPVIGSALVAIATVAAVIIGSRHSAKSARDTADRSAQALLDVENARRDIEETRHLRTLLAKTAAAAQERMFYLTQKAELQFSGSVDLWTEDKDLRLRYTSETLAETLALAHMTTSSPSIRAALDTIEAADQRIADVTYRHDETETSENNGERLQDIRSATGRLAQAAEDLIRVAGEHLATAAEPGKKVI